MNLYRSRRNYFKTGLIHFMAYPDDYDQDERVVQTIKNIAIDDYFDAIEITEISSSDIRRRVRKILDASRLHVSFCAQIIQLKQGININHIDEEERKRAVDVMKRAIDQAYELNADSFAFLSGTYQTESKEEAFESLVNSTLELCEYARKHGNIKMAHEVFDFDIEKRSLIGPSDLARKYAKEVRQSYPDFGLIVDLSHIPLLKESTAACLGTLKDYIVHLHIGNCVMCDETFPAYGDAHPRFGFPNSENDVEELALFLQTLISHGLLDGSIVVSFEVKPYKDEDCDVIIANSKRALNAAWEKIDWQIISRK